MCAFSTVCWLMHEDYCVSLLMLSASELMWKQSVIWHACLSTGV